MAARALTFFKGQWLEGNPGIIGPMTHCMWLSSVVFDGARAFEGVTPDLDLHCGDLLGRLTEQFTEPHTKRGRRPSPTKQPGQASRPHASGMRSGQRHQMTRLGADLVALQPTPPLSRLLWDRPQRARGWRPVNRLPGGADVIVGAI